MAASAGTNPGSEPEGFGVGVGVGVGVRVGVAVADGESLADNVGEGDASWEGEPLGVDVGASPNQSVELQPPRTNAMAMAVKT
jgi:hypothetical protein